MKECPKRNELMSIGKLTYQKSMSAYLKATLSNIEVCYQHEMIDGKTSEMMKKKTREYIKIVESLEDDNMSDYGIDFDNVEFYEQHFDFTYEVLKMTGTCTMAWNIDTVFEIVEKEEVKASQCTLDMLTDFIKDSLNNNQNFRHTLEYVDPDYNGHDKRNRKEILVMHFAPFNANIVIDGNHKLCEYMKAAHDDLIPVYYINSDDYVEAFLNDKYRVLYDVMVGVSLMMDVLEEAKEEYLYKSEGDVSYD